MGFGLRTFSASRSDPILQVISQYDRVCILKHALASVPSSNYAHVYRPSITPDGSGTKGGFPASPRRAQSNPRGLPAPRGVSRHIAVILLGQRVRGLLRRLRRLANAPGCSPQRLAPMTNGPPHQQRHSSRCFCLRSSSTTRLSYRGNMTVRVSDEEAVQGALLTRCLRESLPVSACVSQRMPSPS